MSSARGRVHFEDGYVMHGKYETVSDTMLAMVYPTEAHADTAWTDIRSGSVCCCGGDEPVTLYTEYGHGIAWKGRACRRHGSVTRNQSPFSDDSEIVHPGLIGEES